MEYTEDQMTPWFDGDVLPVHVGLYMREHGFKSFADNQDYWDGKQWFYCSGGEVSTDSPQTSSFYLPWRGLLARPATNDKE